MKIEKTEAYFIRHCDDECCSLGEFYYICPYCGATCINYEAYSKEDDIWGNIPYSINCNKCEKLLTIKYNKKLHIFQVSGNDNKKKLIKKSLIKE